jgi:putative nucleotidyltransferase with HDIG domain
MSIPTQWVERIQNLPVLPQVAMKVTERMQSPTATVKEISDLLRSDVGLTSKILRLANSSYYSIPGGVNDVSKALQYLGFNTIAQIVLTTSVFGAFKTGGLKEFPLSNFWAHSFAVGLLAEVTARSLQFKNPSDAFVGGLMHDMGKLILLELDPEQLSKIVHHAEERKISFLQSEEELELPNHVSLGMELGRHWHLPQPVISAIQFHHGGGTRPEVLLIEWANVWVHAHKIGSSGSFQEDYSAQEQQLSAKLGIHAKQSAVIEEHFQKEFEKAGALLNGS